LVVDADCQHFIDSNCGVSIGNIVIGGKVFGEKRKDREQLWLRQLARALVGNETQEKYPLDCGKFARTE